MATNKNYQQAVCLYNVLPKQVTRKEFNQFIRPHLKKPVKGPAPKLSTYKIFNYILYVLHTGMQWKQLRTRNNELHWSNVYKWHSRWSKNGSYHTLFLSSVITLNDLGKLDLSILHGDGSNTIAKKGGMESATPDTNTRKARKWWKYVIIPAIFSLRQ